MEVGKREGRVGCSSPIKGFSRENYPPPRITAEILAESQRFLKSH